METLQTVSAALGLGLLTGIRLYATVLALGVVLRFHLFTLPSSLVHLNVLAEPWVMTAAGVCCALEFLADKIPWVDSVWDSFHTIIRPVGAAVLGTQILGAQDPATSTALGLLCGGLAFAGHSSKAATRLLVNHSPEPFSNIALSVVEDMAVPFGVWLALKHPVITCVLAGIFLVVFCWTAPKIFRLLQIEWLAVRALLTRRNSEGLEDTAQMALPDVIRNRVVPVPEPYRAALRRDSETVGVFCVAARNVPGLKNSVGYLCFTPDGPVFVAKRFFRYRVSEVGGYDEAHLDRGLLFDTIIFNTDRGKVEFDAFKVRRAAHASARPALSHS